MSDSSICLRIEHIKATASQAGHDLRSGHAPEYIDTQRSHLNDILVPYKSNADIKAINESIRSKHKLRAIRSDQSIAARGLLSFSHVAQKSINALSRDEQNALIRKSIEDVAEALDVELVGAVVHRDESAVHAHFMVNGICRSNGRALSKACTRAVLARLQGTAARAFAHLDIQRGTKRVCASRVVITRALGYTAPCPNCIMICRSRSRKNTMS